MQEEEAEAGRQVPACMGSCQLTLLYFIAILLFTISCAPLTDWPPDSLLPVSARPGFMQASTGGACLRCVRSPLTPWWPSTGATACAPWWRT
jgi:hypothetical protein